MTEPKKEKCEACCGSGYINFWTDDGHISMRTCRRCDGYGYIEAKPMTNEEWFCQLPTEEKAKFFVMIEMSAMHPVKRGSIDTKKFIEDVTEWLKQPHKE